MVARRLLAIARHVKISASWQRIWLGETLDKKRDSTAGIMEIKAAQKKCLFQCTGCSKILSQYKLVYYKIKRSIKKVINK